MFQPKTAPGWVEFGGRYTSISLDTRSVASKCSVEDSRAYLATVEAVDAPRVIRRRRQVAAGDEDAAGFRVVLADPHWTFQSNSLAAPGRNPRRHYACLTVDQLCQLPLAEQVARNAVQELEAFGKSGSWA